MSPTLISPFFVEKTFFFLQKHLFFVRLKPGFSIGNQVPISVLEPKLFFFQFINFSDVFLALGFLTVLGLKK
jgi:hypothetical protein